MTRLSLVVPIYQLGKYLAPMLATVAAQTVDFELWLVLDGTTDQSAQVATEFVDGHPDWHVLALPKHSGISRARNVGLAHATGDAVVFVDGDDELAPDFVETLAAGFGQGVVATTVGYRWWGGGVSRSRGWEVLDQAQMFAQVSQHGTAVGGYVWNKAFLRSAIGDLRFDESLRLAEDYWFTASFVAANAGRYLFDPQVRYTKVMRPNSTIHTAGYSGRAQEAVVFSKIARLGEHLDHRDDNDWNG
ncbi:glycosyltransferase family 2 protein [Lacticaseibacillus sp. GG6-2]